jgi:hypothetical protein
MGEGRGQDPEKKTGQERAAEVHERNEERRADREEGEASQGGENLPEKPPAEEELPEEGEPVGDDVLHADLQPLSDDEFLGPDEAREDPTVDDEEREVQPHTDLPEGARAEDYEAGEETPPVERGQREG